MSTRRYEMAKKAKKAKNAKKAKKAKTRTTAKRGTTSTRAAGRRDLVKGKNATMFAKRSGTGRFKEIDEAGKSQKADRRTKAKRKVKSGYGDRGDR
jgi:hypothetical protein